MPGGDRTGPWGFGSMTGRARGFCAGYTYPGYMSYGFGRGYGRGYGWGYPMGGYNPYGYGYGYPGYPYGAGAPSMSQEEELGYLKQEKDLMEKELKDLSERISKIEKEEKAK
jgi:hypothetical protein